MSMRVAAKKTYQPDDLLKIVDGHRFELVDGKLVRRHMGTISSWVGGILYAALLDYCRANRFGWVLHADAGFVCFPHRPASVRYPDIAVIRYGRLPGEQLPEGHVTIAPDLAVEVVSPNEKVEELEGKVEDYLTAGVPLVWVIYPQMRRARIYRPDRTTVPLEPDAALSGEQVLPGFQVRLADLFPPAAPTQP